MKPHHSCRGRILVAGMAILLLQGACAAYNDYSRPMPPHYTPIEKKVEAPSPGSLWRDSSGWFEDRKARAVNDLVTIKIEENTLASNQAETGTGRNSSMEAKIPEFFGIPLSYDMGKIVGKGMAGITITPSVSVTGENEFSGRGNTTRAGSLTATITARIVEVLPNGNFVIESRKDISINREKEILILRGVIRPDDIAADNTISSGYIANAQMTYTGDGVIGDKQGQGWLVQVLDWIWPF
ncbi:MAG: flagellar basal body L-ring protein FlgH [Thermodesulfobacteriota bacterium]